MKCDLCNKDASVFLTQIINGQMTTVNLCETCSQEKGVTDTAGFGLAEAFIGPTSARSRDVSCASCGFTQSQLKKIGRMGCPECYDTFRDGLDNLLSAMHKGTTHVGKVPHNLSSAPLRSAIATTPPSAENTPSRKNADELRKTVMHLRNQLQKAVAEERFEDAARLKNEIRDLEQQLTKA
jgi:protein arginine kinase activator